MSDKVKGLLGKLKGLSNLTEIQTFSKSAESDKKIEWISTDFYDLNRIMSGNLYRFMRADKVVQFFGPEQTGKSLILYNLIKNAQQKGYIPVLFDTENAFSADILETFNIDPEKGFIVKTPTVEDLKLAYFHIVEKMRKECPDEKFIFALDSLGNLGSMKDYNDMDKNAVKLDQGLLQRMIKSFMKNVIAYTAITKWPFVFTNHVVGNPNKMNKYEKDKPVGGYSIRYLSNQMISLSIRAEKDSEKNVEGMTIKAVTEKNRVVPPYQTGLISLNFKTGIGDRFIGLLELMEKAGLAKQVATRWYINHLDKKFYAKHISKNPNEVFTSKILEKLNEFLANTGYQSIDIETKMMIEMENVVIDEEKIDE